MNKSGVDNFYEQHSRIHGTYHIECNMLGLPSNYTSTKNLLGSVQQKENHTTSVLEYLSLASSFLN
jgi:formylmethanofuran dehydrogenase subunit A